MLYQCEIQGISPVIHHSAVGMDPALPINEEIKTITAKRGTNRTETDDTRLRELETVRSIWYDQNDSPTIPTAALRAVIETAARKLKQGPRVREGLVVVESAFSYDVDKYGVSVDELGTTTQFTVPVVVQRNRVLRTRAKFDLPWGCGFKVDADDELVDVASLTRWLEIAGRRVGLGDWRPDKSGEYGRFEVVSVEASN